MRKTVEQTAWGQTFRIRADFAQAGDSIEGQSEDGEWTPTGWQVADFAHDSDAAMNAYIGVGLLMMEE